MRCDRRHMRLYAVTDRAWLGARTLCEQVREKELEEAAFLQEARELSALCRRYGVPFLVNDNVDIALASGADGVHVGQEDMDPAQVRLRAGKDMLLGVSVHTVEEAREAVRKGADYLGVGAMFPTGTKADAERVPRQVLRNICAAVDVPVVAIGGLNRESIPRLSGSGVDGVALVSAIFSAEDIEGACRELLALSERLAEPLHGGQSQGSGKEKAR